jgi:hypothetical protein
MKQFKVTKTETIISYIYVTAEDWETAEEIASDSPDLFEREFGSGSMRLEAEEIE